MKESTEAPPRICLGHTSEFGIGSFFVGTFLAFLIRNGLCLDKCATQRFASKLIRYESDDVGISHIAFLGRFVGQLEHDGELNNSYHKIVEVGAGVWCNSRSISRFLP